jgi:ABC-type phosphate transport system substrate-binding protein
MRSLVAVGALALTATTVMAVPAMADPINSSGHKVTPAAYDIVSVGSESIYAISDQLSFNYNKTVGKRHSPKNPYYYSWDAVPFARPNATTTKIILKAGCKKNLRPDGSSAGISALSSYGKTGKYPCVDFARSSRPRKSTDPLDQPGGDVFVTLWRDSVTYATTSNTNAPSTLTLPQLQAIFGCNVGAAHGFAKGTWGALLGPKAKDPKAVIDPILPQAGSGTLSFWQETALGFTTDTEPLCGTAANLTTIQQPEENEGLSKVFLLHGKPNPNVIYPFSIGAWAAQQYHSAKCGKKPSKTQNKFGCNENGVFHLNSIDGTAPLKGKVTNPKFPAPFNRFLYAVVPYSTQTSNHIPSRLERLLEGKTGYFCSKKQAKVVTSYGFETTPLCGLTG